MKTIKTISVNIDQIESDEILGYEKPGNVSFVLMDDSDYSSYGPAKWWEIEDSEFSKEEEVKILDWWRENNFNF